MNTRPLLPLLALHAAAGGICFAFFAITPIVICLVCMAIGNDPGGPMFFPIFVVGTVLCAAVLAAIISGTALLSDLVRRRRRLAFWLPPLAVFVSVTGVCWLAFRDAKPAIPPLVGAAVAIALVVHGAAVSLVWFLSRLLFRQLRRPRRPA